MKKNYSGFNKDTAKNLMLDAGAIYVNYNVEESFESQADKLLGATSGGNTFEATPEFRQVEVDGVKGAAKGLTFLDSWEVKLNTNMLEFREETFKYALAAAEVKDATVNEKEYREIRAKGYVSDTDYVDNITFIGTLSGSNDPVIIQIYNALSLEGLSVNFADSSDIVAELSFQGHLDPGNLDNPPFAIFMPVVSEAVTE